MTTAVTRVNAAEIAGRPLRYFDFVMAAFVVVLVLSNVIGAGKRAEIELPFIGLWPFGAGILFFPVSYVIGDVLTEVYGYARARRCIWAGFAALLFMAGMSWVVVQLPPAQGWTGQDAYESVFGQVPRIVFASMIAFWAGEFVNSFVLARLKIWTAGRHLWTRTIGSTVAGQGVDSLIFYPLAFYGAPDWPVEVLGTVILSQFVLKCGATRRFRIDHQAVTKKGIRHLFDGREVHDDAFRAGFFRDPGRHFFTVRTELGGVVTGSINPFNGQSRRKLVGAPVNFHVLAHR